MTTSLTPGTAFPEISVDRLGGGQITTSGFDAPFMTVLNVYRGLHCPRCQRQLGGLLAEMDTLNSLGAKLVAISTDPEDRAAKAAEEWGLGGIDVGYGLSIETARSLGLHISSSIADKETEFFAEPGVFLIGSDGVLWGSVVGSSPFMRPDAAQILDALSVIKERSYPARGTVAA